MNSSADSAAAAEYRVGVFYAAFSFFRRLQVANIDLFFGFLFLILLLLHVILLLVASLDRGSGGGEESNGEASSA